jgi:phospholipase D1/2
MIKSPGYTNIEHLAQLETNVSLDNSNYIDSFSRETGNNKVVLLIGGAEYFNDLHEKLLTAQRSIYIAMFWLSPELYLLRPVLKGRSDLRIMDILKMKAEQGAVIKILIYKEIKGSLPNNSKHTYKLLTSLHPNIQVNTTYKLGKEAS